MRRLCIWLLCLLLIVPCAAFASEHALTENVNQGTCRSLTGEVPLMVVFVDTPEAQWNPDDCASFRSRIDDAVTQLELEATGYGASLSIEPAFFTAQVAENLDAADPWPLVEQTLLAVPDFINIIIETKFRETPILLCLPESGRCMAFAAEDEELEYVILFSDADAGSARHELLHLYGAKDFYFHDEVKAAAQEYFPDSIMLDDSAASTVDSFTAWCIGWTEKPNPSAERFLADTAHITPNALDAALEESIYTGFTTLERDDGVYIGMLVDGQFHGTGIFQSRSGASYAGQWAYGKAHGYGTYQWPSGSSYTGDFLEGRKTGQGVMRWQDGTVYTGDFVNDSRTGQGIICWPDGSSYAGDFLSDVITGVGVFTWADGSSYTGSFLEGLCHGEGIYTSPDGSITTGTWAHGVLIE